MDSRDASASKKLQHLNNKIEVGGTANVVIKQHINILWNDCSIAQILGPPSTMNLPKWIQWNDIYWTSSSFINHVSSGSSSGLFLLHLCDLPFETGKIPIFCGTPAKTIFLNNCGHMLILLARFFQGFRWWNTTNKRWMHCKARNKFWSVPTCILM